jgi:hypothetical protein
MRNKSNSMKHKPATEPLCAPEKRGRKAYVAFSFFLYQYGVARIQLKVII